MTVFTKPGAGSKRVFYAGVPQTGDEQVEGLFRANGYNLTLSVRNVTAAGLLFPPQHWHRAIYEQVVDLNRFEVRFMTVRHPVTRLLAAYGKDLSDVDGFQKWLRRVNLVFPINHSAMHNRLRPQVDFHHPGLTVFRYENGFNGSWAKRLSEEFELGFTAFDVPEAAAEDVDVRNVPSDVIGLATEFCHKNYGLDFQFFGYPEEAV